MRTTKKNKSPLIDERDKIKILLNVLYDFQKLSLRGKEDYINIYEKFQNKEKDDLLKQIVILNIRLTKLQDKLDKANYLLEKEKLKNN